MEVKSSDFSDVFVSYRRKDVEFTKQLVEALQADGKEVWIDWEDIPPGSVGFSDDIKRGLEGADAFIAILTPDYLESPYCMDMELKYAVDLKKKLIPVVLKKFDDYEIPADISHINWIYFTPHAGHENTFQESLPKVLQALDTDLDHVRTHKRLLLPALEWDSNERKPSYLLRGNVLTQAEAWLAAATNKTPDPTELHAQFIFESRKATIAQQHQRLMYALAAAVVMALLTVFAAFQWRAAERNRRDALRNAEESRSLALAAGAQLNLNNNNLDLAVALALEGSSIEAPPQDTVLVLDEASHLPGTRFVLDAHEGEARSVAIHPNGTTLLSGGNDGQIFVWDIETREQQGAFAGHEAAVLDIVYSSAGDFVVSADANGMILVWDSASQNEIQRLETEHGAASAIALTPNEDAVLAGYADGTVMRWHIESGTSDWEQQEHADAVNALVINSDGSQAVSGSGDANSGGTIVVWDVESGDVISSAQNNIDDVAIDGVTAAAFTTDEDIILLGLARNGIMLWDIANQAIVKFLEGHTGLVTSIALSPDGLFVISGSADTFARFWSLNADEGREEIWRFEGHTGTVNDLAFSPDGRLAITAAADGTLRVWELFNSALAASFYGHGNIVDDVAFASDETKAVTVSWDGSARVTDLETGLVEATMDSNGGVVTGVKVIPESGLVVSSSSGSDRIVVWNLDTGEVVYSLDAPHTDWVPDIAVTSDGSTLISVSRNDRVLARWNLEDGTLIDNFSLEGFRPLSIDLSASDQLVAIGSFEGIVVIFDLEAGEEIQRWSVGESVRGWEITFTPDDTGVIIGMGNNNAALYDVASGNLIRTYAGHSGTVIALDITRDGRFLVTGAEDSTVRVWNIETGEQLRRITMMDEVASLLVNDAGTQALVGLDNGSYHLVNIPAQTAEELIAFARDNRHVPEFTCYQRLIYHLDNEECTE